MIKTKNIERNIQDEDKHHFHNVRLSKDEKEMIYDLKQKGFNISQMLRNHIADLHNEHC